MTDASTAPTADATPPAPPAMPDTPRAAAAYRPETRWSGTDPLAKSPLWAAALSLVPGLGQVYVGYTRLGFVHALVVGTCFVLLNSDLTGAMIPLVSIFLLFFWLYNVVDAYRRAKLYNEARAGRLDLELPHGLPEASFRGSIAGGAVLMGLGLLLLTNTLFGLSLEWLEDWWPMGLVAGGAYLFVMALRDRRREEKASEV